MQPSIWFYYSLRHVGVLPTSDHKNPGEIDALGCRTKQAIGVKVIEGIDVSDSDSGTRLVDAVREQLGDGETLDYVICNAG